MNPQSTQAVASRWNAVMMSNYGTPTVQLVRGSGSRVWDVDGVEYLDLIGGIATTSLGHAHPAVSAAVAKQSEQLVHVSNLYAHDTAMTLAEKLVELLGQPAKVFFSQDGATANEAAIKLARLHAANADPTGAKVELIAMTGSFHGRTMGALSVTGSPAKQDPFRPLLEPVTFVPYGDIEAIVSAVTDATAAVFVEPVMGEAGVIIPPVDYLSAIREACTRHNALLVVDEVQSGIGRTGQWFASISQGVVPDVITLAKGIAGGLPLGVCIGIGDAGDLFQPGNHGSTFGGNAVTCAAALAVIETIESEGVLANVVDVSAYLAAGLAVIENPLLVEVRHQGLWFGLQLAEPVAKELELKAREAGFLINAVAPDAIRLAPALTLTREDAQEFLDALPGLLEAVKS